ncbi:trypsin-1 [Procambarus clarkii]|uniref:trypsin-1 n=1 Tax=Procambarus clarkii TaxID=6728 RepID=UPI001E678772|nr:trypsin-1-like [Procambarus clarkii]
MTALIRISVFVATAIATVAFGPTLARSVYCGGHADLQVGYSISIRSPNHPYAYPRPLKCIWTVSSPANTVMRLICPTFHVKPSSKCQDDTFWVFPSANIYDVDGKYYCGTGTLNVLINNNSFGAIFEASPIFYFDYYTGFNCKLTVENKIITSTTISPKTVTSSITEQCGVKGASRVVGGQDAAVNEWPWQAGVRRMSDGMLFCGAALISSQWLVTAAHCVVPFTVQDIFVSLGDHELKLGENTPFTRHITVAEKIVHEKFNPHTANNDIALIRLSGSVKYNAGIRSICLPCQYVKYNLSGENGTVTGWGTVSEGGKQSDVLQEVELPILTTDECKAHLNESVTANMICTYLPGYDACKGDSGGPLSWLKKENYYLVGVISFGIGCAKQSLPGVYTKVANYLQWIEKKSSVKFCS